MAKNKKQQSAKELFNDLLSYAKMYIFPFLAVLALALMSYLVYVPYIEQIPDLLMKKSTLSQNIDTLDRNKAELETLNQLPLDSMLSLLDQTIPTEPKVSSLVELIVEQAEESGLEVAVPSDVSDEDSEETESLLLQYLNQQQEESSIEDETASEDETQSSEKGLEEVSASEREAYEDELGVIPIPVEITLMGTRDQLRVFFGALSTNGRVMTIRSVSVDVQGNVWQANLLIYGFVGTVPESALPTYSEIEADSESVFSKVNSISIDLTQERFDQITSSL